MGSTNVARGLGEVGRDGGGGLGLCGLGAVWTGGDGASGVDVNGSVGRLGGGGASLASAPQLFVRKAQVSSGGQHCPLPLRSPQHEHA